MKWKTSDLEIDPERMEGSCFLSGGFLSASSRSYSTWALAAASPTWGTLGSIWLFYSFQNSAMGNME